MLHVGVKENGHHESDDFAGREMLSGGFVGHLRETANQVLENISHLIVAYGFRRKVKLLRKFLHNQIQEVRPVQAVNLGVDVKRFQYGSDIFRKAFDIVDQIVPNQHGVIHQRVKGKFADIVKLMLADGSQKRSLVFVVYSLVLFHNRIMRVFQNAVQAAEYRKGQYDITVFALLVVAPQEIGNFPYKVRSLRFHLGQFPSCAFVGNVRYSFYTIT